MIDECVNGETITSKYNEDELRITLEGSDYREDYHYNPFDQLEYLQLGSGTVTFDPLQFSYTKRGAEQRRQSPLGFAL